MVTRYALSSGASSRGVFAGAPGFVVPIRKCPLDHFLEPASMHPASIREFSFLSNPRAAGLKSSTAKTALAAGASAATELKRLVTDYGQTKVLHITNKPIGACPALAGATALTGQRRRPHHRHRAPGLLLAGALDAGWLDDETQRRFKQKFGGASGSWCCAPGDEARKGAARSSYFRLMTRPRAQIRFGRRAQAKAAGKGRGRLLG